jgi:nitroreductase
MLALEERGLADVPYTPSNPTLVGEALKLPKGQQVITILPIGYDADSKPKENRRSFTEIVRHNQFDIPYTV